MMWLAVAPMICLSLFCWITGVGAIVRVFYHANRDNDEGLRAALGVMVFSFIAASMAGYAAARLLA